MKRIFLMIVLAAASLTSCQKAPSAADINVNVTIRAHAPGNTRTVFGARDNGAYPVLWTTSVQAAIYAGSEDRVCVTPSSAGTSTSFSASLPSSASGKLRVLSPVGNYVSAGSSSNAGGFTQKYIGSTYTYAYAVIPASQTALNGSCDEKAQLIAAEADIPSSGIPSSIDMSFRTVNSFGKLVISGIKASSLDEVRLSFPEGVCGESCKYMLESGEIDNASGKQITLDASGVSKESNGDFCVWFGCAPASMSSGEFSVSITDGNGKTYEKSATLSAGKKLEFVAGHVLPINMTFEPEPETPPVTPPSDGTWTLVTSAGDLSAGDLVVIANNAMGVTAGELSSSVLEKVSTVFSVDKHSIEELGEGTVVFTLGGQAGAWTLNTEDGKLGATTAKKLAWNSGTTTWKISISATGDANIENGTASYGQILYNGNSPRFTTYTSDPNASMLLPQIYSIKGDGSTPDQPGTDNTTVTTLDATSITNYTASLNASFSKAATSPREAGFEWGLSSTVLNNVQQCSTAPSGTQGTFSASIDNLGEGVTYYYRAYIIVNDGGNIKYYYGSVRSFTTRNDHAGTTSGYPVWYELPQMSITKQGNYLINASNSNEYFGFNWCAGGEKGPTGRVARNYTVCFSGTHHCPVWVAAPRHSMYTGSSGRSGYSTDPKIPANLQYGNTDTGGGCNKGHMLGSAERTCSSATNKQVFYYTNIAPQLSTGFNTGGGGWNILEDWVDGQVCADTLYEVIGCYFDTYTDGYGNTVTPKKISFGVLDDVSMPTMFYYILLRTKSGSSKKALKDCSASELKCAAFVRSHTNSLKGQKVSSREMMSVSDLEKITGWTYFPNVPNAPKSTCNPSDWGL